MVLRELATWRSLASDTEASKTSFVTKAGEGLGSRGNMFEAGNMRFSVNEQITFAEEPGMPYQVKAIGPRFAILTRPATEEDARAFEVECPLEGVVGENSVWG